jgi:class 3 adenylate cyclase
MQSGHYQSERHMRELRLFLEEICCNMCRFRHVEGDGVVPEAVRISQEAYLGRPGAYADIRVHPPGKPPYVVEVKYGYPSERIVAHLLRKYGDLPAAEAPARIVLVVDTRVRTNWAATERQLKAGLPGSELEVWDEDRLCALLERRFGVRVESFSEQAVLELRAALDSAKGRYAFGDQWVGDELQSALLWHFGFWRLKQLRESGRLDARSILAPGIYDGVAVLVADLCSFSSYVRDTTDDDVVRHCLTAFYSKARYEVLNTGGMLYQFVGDEVLALYGLPERTEGAMEAAMRCARSLLSIGNAISMEWQRHIDRVQERQGVHIGIAMGDIHVVSLRPFGRAHLSAVSDGINMAARLLACAGPSEIVVSNAFYQELEPNSQEGFRHIDPVDARNMGRINAWKQSIGSDGANQVQC